METRLDPERPLSFYSRLRNLLPRMPHSWGGCSALPPRWLYEHVSVAKIDLRIISLLSHVRQLFPRIEDGQSSYCWLRFDLVCRRHSLVLSGMIRLFPIDRTNGCDYSYQSRANNPFGSSPTPFPSIVHSDWLLGVCYGGSNSLRTSEYPKPDRW